MACPASSEVEGVSLEDHAAQIVGCPAGKVGATIASTSLDQRPESSCSQYWENERPTQLHCTCPSCPGHTKQTELPDRPNSPGKKKLEEFMRRSAFYMINTAKPPA